MARKKLRDPEAAEQDEGWLNAMPSSLVTLEVVEESDDGDLYGLADDPAWKNLGRLLLPPNRLPLAVGQRVLTRLHRQEDGSVLVRLIRILPTITTETVVGVFERHHDGGLVWSINRRQAIPVKLDRQCVLEHKLGDGWLLKVAITAAPIAVWVGFLANCWRYSVTLRPPTTSACWRFISMTFLLIFPPMRWRRRRRPPPPPCPKMPNCARICAISRW
jgi:hypothetical protein